MIIDRKKEQAVLNKLLKSNKSEFLAVYGRRRIGKTFLIHEFLKDKGIYFLITGTKNASKCEQLKNFHRGLRTVFPQAEEEKKLKEWSDAFYLIKKESNSSHTPPSSGHLNEGFRRQSLVKLFPD